MSICSLLAIIFIDEIDAIATKRFDAQTGADREVQRILLELLNQMDGFDQTVNVKVIMATNRADTLDPALLRPGRLDRWASCIGGKFAQSVFCSPQNPLSYLLICSCDSFVALPNFMKPQPRSVFVLETYLVEYFKFSIHRLPDV